MIIDGRAISRELLAHIREEGVGGIVRAITVAPTAATRSYLRIKERAAQDAGMQLDVVQLPDDATTDDVLAAIDAPAADAVIVQLPLPAGIDTERVLAAIPIEKDADVLSPAARARSNEKDAFVAPVAAAVDEILVRAGVSPEGKHVAVIGKGRLVGEPVAARLAAQGAHVTSYDEHDFSPSSLADADIIVAGSGVPHLVKPEMIKDGVVLIDAGTSEQPTDSGTALVGDIDPACAERASVYTPVPGGVGPITVACLFRTVAALVKLRKS
jgi:methylenetetrahydrofolate dehydrogenase (NADP+)/methenyltetrahydrofolate cyclohydrolase